MTVKEAMALLQDVAEFYVSWNGSITPLDPNDEFLVDAFGDYRIKSIVHGTKERTMELQIAAIPVKETRA